MYSTHSKKIGIGLILLVFLSFSIVVPLSTVTPSVVVVKFDDSQEVLTAVRVISQNTNTIVVDYGSLGYYLNLARPKLYTVWVGHGGQDGIRVNGEIEGWDTLATEIEKSTGRDIVISCESVKLMEFNVEALPLGFGPIDAKFGSYLTLAIIHRDINYLWKAYQTIISIQNGQSVPEILDLSYQEITYWGAMMIITAVGLLINWPPSWNQALKILAFMSFSVVTRMILSFVYYYLGWLSYNTLLSRSIDFLLAVINALSAWWNSLSLWAKIAIGLGIGATIAEIALSGGAVAAAKAAIFVSSMLYYSYMMYRDWSDNNDYVG